jgi:phosphatidylserine/phosphatidylglycerophosphate/cardiolipin synthase-like enzyme
MSPVGPSKRLHRQVKLARAAEEMAAMPLARAKHKPAAPMHLKSYQIDGRLLRTGAANFSASGLKRQENDLVTIERAGAAAGFKRAFDARFVSGETVN